MNQYLLDTNIISELRRPRPHGAVTAWFGDKAESQIFLSAVTLGELQAGVERTRHQNPGKAIEIEAWIDRITATFRVLPMDATCFREWARLMDGNTDARLGDAMIAATARVHGLVVATRNERDFAQLDVRIVNPFKSS